MRILALWALACVAALAAPNWEAQRARMVQAQLRARGIRSERVLQAMACVPRHEFVPELNRSESYADRPVPIGFRQTISQPYVVALMTELLQLRGDERVLEIGTGSGYQAAVLSSLAREVYTIEIVPELARRATDVLKPYSNVFTRCGDGYVGWPQKAPFQAILVTAAPDHVPQPLQEQLAEGGRMVIPVGLESQEQKLKLLVKEHGVLKERDVLPVRFVPLTRPR